MNCIERSNVLLKDYQIKVVEYILNPTNEGLLVVHFCGMGKSLSAVASSQGFLDSDDSHNVIFISGKSLLSNFQKEMDKYGVINREKYSFYTYCKVMHLFKQGRIDEIECNKKTMLVVDEVHNLKTFGSKTYEAVQELASRSQKRLLLTATPFVNSLLDFTVPINLIYGSTVLGTKSGFSKGVVADYISKPKGPFIVGHNRDILVRYLKNKCYYLKQITSDYPETREKHVEIFMDPEYEDKYEKLMKKEKVNNICFKAPEVFYNGYRRAVNCINTENHDDFTMKLTAMLPVIKKEGKTLIYTNWIEFGIEPIIRFLKKHGISHRSFYGDVPAEERTEIIKDYNADKYKVLIITKAGGEGIDLMETRNVIILDPTWNPTTLVQIKSRAVRYRSHNNLSPDLRCVDIYYTVLKARKPGLNTGDSALYEIIGLKEEAEKRSNWMLQSLSI